MDSYSDGTHSVQRIYWLASDAMLHVFKYVPLKKQTKGEYIFIIRLAIPLTVLKCADVNHIKFISVIMNTIKWTIELY